MTSSPPPKAAGKPLTVAAYSWAGARLGPDALRALLAAGYKLQFSLGAVRGPLLAAYARVLGRRPSADEARRYLERLAARYADSMTSLYTLDALPPERRFCGVETPAVEAIEALRRRGRGVILASPHFGNVPLALGALAARGVPLTALFVHAAPYKWCEAAFGFRVAGLGESAAQVWSALKENGAVMIYSDLDFFPEGRTSPFFGAPVRPPHGLARLALACGSPVLPVYTVCEGGRRRVEADAPIEPEGAPEDLENAVLRSMERAIAARPDHWLVLRDIWDIDASDRQNKRLLGAVSAYKRLFGA